jgi:hypothetical protein
VGCCGQVFQAGLRKRGRRGGLAIGGRREGGVLPMSRGNGFPFSDLDILGGNFNRNFEEF